MLTLLQHRLWNFLRLSALLLLRLRLRLRLLLPLLWPCPLMHLLQLLTLWR